VRWLDELGRDLKFGIRQLAAAPMFTVVAVLTLALGLGATAAMLSVVNAVLLRPFPVLAQERLAMIWVGPPGQPRRGRPPFAVVEAWRQGRSFEDIAIFDGATVTLSSREGAERVGVARVSPNFFPLLGLRVLAGRLLTSDDAVQRRRVVLISRDFWQERFGGSPDVIGSSLVLDGVTSSIIGVLPQGPPRLSADIWETHTMFPDWEQRLTVRNAGSWFAIGRLNTDVNAAQAEAEAGAIVRTLDQDVPAADRLQGASVMPLSHFVVGDTPRLALWLLTGAVIFVLLVAAANVAGLSLARAVGRARELAIRTTLGATPGRIVRQLLAEGVVLAAVAGLLGAYFAAAAVRVILTYGPPDLARLDESDIDGRVLAGLVAATALTGILVSLAPALMRRHPRLPREEGDRGASTGSSARHIRRGLVIAELALAIVLLTGAGLLIRSWQQVAGVDPGFRPQRILSLQLSTTAFTGASQRSDFYLRVLDELQSLPGVESAGVVSDLFVSSDGERPITVEGVTGAVPQRVRLRADEASEDLFGTIGAALVQGRFFSNADRQGAPPVIIVNRIMAQRLWPGQDPIGRRFKFGPPDADTPWLTVIGVVGDMRRQGLEIEPIPQVFEALRQSPPRLGTLLVRTVADDPLTILPAVRAAVRRVDADVPVYAVTTLDARLERSLAQRRFQTALLVAFASLALVLAAIGVFGVVHYMVATRTQEIGIRAAVGARRADILGLIVWEGAKLTAAGAAFGLAGALLVGRAGSGLLFGVTAADPLTFAGVTLLLVAVAAAACVLPAWRASRIAPLSALQRS
jgi:predicted permease